jgi:hypothetical protein
MDCKTPTMRKNQQPLALVTPEYEVDRCKGYSASVGHTHTRTDTIELLVWYESSVIYLVKPGEGGVTPHDMNSTISPHLCTVESTGILRKPRNTPMWLMPLISKLAIPHALQKKASAMHQALPWSCDPCNKSVSHFWQDRMSINRRWDWKWTSQRGNEGWGFPTAVSNWSFY